MTLNLERIDYANYECVQLENAHITLWLTTEVGPRVIGLSFHDQDNLFAVLPEAKVTTPSGIVYNYRGGHRLWHAPEDLERTYTPDDNQLSISWIAGGVRAIQPVEGLTGIEKAISITMPDDGPLVVVDHMLRNKGPWSVDLAPWAITQFKPGGFAVLPQPEGEGGLLPNRRFALWPYTPINSPIIKWGDKYIFVQATMKTGKLKIGWANVSGWLAYWIEGTLFVKYTRYRPDESYYDLGSSSECYCDSHCLELETLGPKTSLEPGESVSHREVWRLHNDVQLTPDELAVAEVDKKLSIGAEHYEN